MDSFVEQLVPRQKDGRDIAQRVCIIVAGVSLSLFGIFSATIFFPLILITFGAVYLTWYLLGNINVEYEYILTNNDLDIDKVIGKRKRKRLITIKLNTVQKIEPFTEDTDPGKCAATVVATDGTGANLWYLIAEHSASGRVLLLFKPNEDMLGAIYDNIPYQVRNEMKKIFTPAEKVSEDETTENAEIVEASETDK